MDVTIFYCNPCGYRDQADALARELRQRFGADVEVTEGKLGQFDVLIDGQLVASKAQTFWGRMLKHGAPPQEEILAAIERHTAVADGDHCELPATDRTKNDLR